MSLLLAHQVVRVYCYVTVVSLQYLTPLILTLNCTLLLKTLGERKLPLGVGVSWGGSLKQLCPQPRLQPLYSFLPPPLPLLSSQVATPGAWAQPSHNLQCWQQCTMVQ